MFLDCGPGSCCCQVCPVRLCCSQKGVLSGRTPVNSCQSVCSRMIRPDVQLFVRVQYLALYCTTFVGGNEGSLARNYYFKPPNCEISSQRPLDFFEMCERKRSEVRYFYAHTSLRFRFRRGLWIVFIPELTSKQEGPLLVTSSARFFKRSREGTSLAPSTSFNADNSQAPG